MGCVFLGQNNVLKKSILFVAVAGLLPISVLASGPSRLPDDPIPLTTEGIERTPPIIEAFEPFLSTGDISRGFELPTGAIWRPQLLVWGDFRSALQTFDNGDVTTEEWANRLNLFAHLRLSGTERFVASIRPLDEDGEFSGRRFEPDEDDIDATNNEINTFFFEGEIGEIFPNLDPADSKKLDWGFAVGRQPVFKQEGMLINDNIDAIGIVRNSILISGLSNTRIAGMYGWNEVNRNDRVEDEEADFFGLFTEIDSPCCTITIDYIFIDTDEPAGNGSFLGLSSVQRFGHVNSSIRLLISDAEETDSTAVGTGSLVFVETSFTPTGTDNNLYINGFSGKDEYTPAALSPAVGGPLARTGILFAAVGLGSYGSPLNNNSADIFGGAIGYQMFFTGGRKQLIFEAAVRDETEGAELTTSAVGARYQQAFGKHTILVLDAFTSDQDEADDNSGGRVELRFKF
jgi:hypothetical protein